MASLEKFSLKSAVNRIISAYNLDPKKYDRKGLFILIFIQVSENMQEFYYQSHTSLYYQSCLKQFFLIFQNIFHVLFDLFIDKLIMGCGVVFVNVFILICYNTIMIFIYKAKNPFFEKYRVNPVDLINYIETMALVIKLR